jgi:peptidoglycan/xylan/chitin deacetylase (PgdA/CDA1 family)
VRAVLLALALTLSAWAEPPRHLPVLCYHQIHPKAETEMVTTPQRFSEQLDYLAREGYQTVTLEQAGQYLSGHMPKKFPARPVLITFDDGYDGVYRYGYPALKKHRMRAVVFLVVGQVGKLKPTPHLTRKQVEEMDRSRVFEFGSHTYDMHVPIPERVAAKQLSNYRLGRDLIRSREVLQKWLGHEVRALAWPYGHYDDNALRVAMASGFRMVFTTDYGYNFPKSGCQKIRRIRLSSDWDTVEVLRAKLESGG